jgi:hypothetical protein
VNAPPLSTGQGQCFQFAVPEGWRVIEEGQFAVVLCSPDDTAMTIMVGNCGYPQGMTNPVAYAHEKLSMGGPAQLGQPRPGRAVGGFEQALEMDYAYAVNGIPCQGVATVSVRNGYGSTDLVLTAGAAQQAHWPRFAAWLPGVAAMFAVTNGAAWGARGVAQQNLANSIAFGEQLAEHRRHSEQLQREVTDQRWASDERRQHDRGEVLSGESWYADPYGNPPQRLSDTAAVYWVNPQGVVKPSDDPSYDPRTAEDPYWQRMPRT